MKHFGCRQSNADHKCKLFKFLKERLPNIVNGWIGRWLSKRGKELLIKCLVSPSDICHVRFLTSVICENLEVPLHNTDRAQIRHREVFTGQNWRRFAYQERMAGLEPA